MLIDDGLSIPDFLKRPLDPNAKRTITRRRNADRKIPYPKGGYGSQPRRQLPKSMDATAWAILREQEKLAEQKKQARLAALKALRG